MLLLVVALTGCSPTRDRDGPKVEPAPSAETCAARGLTYCLVGTRAVCTELAADPLNCGACGTVCGVGVDCSSGVCGTGAATCGAQSGEAVCGSPEYPVCVDTMSDERNCGGCDLDCGTFACVASACDVPCAAPAPDKCQVAGTWTCVDFQTDPRNCNGCNTVCASCVAGVCTPETPSLTVSARFPLHGADWNSWVQGADWTTAADLPCDPTSTASCVHAGELRQVVVSGRTTCTGLSAADALGAFDWSCDGSTSPVRMVSTGLKTGKRLSDLLNVPALTWATNSVTVTDGTSVYGHGTSGGPWWGNPVEPVPASGALTSAGTVYVASGSTVAAVIDVGASGVALTIVPPTVFGPAAPVARAVIAAVVAQTGGLPRDFLWIEGSVDATRAPGGVLLSGVRRSVVRNVDVRRAAVDLLRGKYGLKLVQATGNRLSRIVAIGHVAGIRLEGSSNNDLTFLEAAQCGDGIQVDKGSNGNRLAKVSVASNHVSGVAVSWSDDNSLDGVIASNNTAGGIHIWMTARTKVANSVVAFNREGGLVLSNGRDCRVVGVTTVGNRRYGLKLYDVSGSVVMGVATYHDEGGARFFNTSTNTVVDLAISSDPASPAPDISSEYGATNRFVGTLLLGAIAPPRCVSDGTSDPGYDPACLPTGTSAFSRVTTLPWSDSFVPPDTITSDSVNGSFAGGPVYFTDMDAAFDWTGFQNGYRMWGAFTLEPLGCPLPSYRTEGACTLAGEVWNGAATLYDWSLGKGDTILRERLAAPLPGDALHHAWSIDPALASDFLPHAMELSSAAGGNDDLLCEPGETCLYTPNYGAYQGHGKLTAVSGSTSLWRYDPATNGY